MSESKAAAIVRKILKALVMRGSEMALALGLVALLAFIFLMTLMIVFPKGTGLVQLYGDILGPEQSSQGQNAVVGRGASSGTTGPAAVAVLTEVLRNVKDRPGDAVAWTPSRIGTTIDDGHAVQTLAGSAATLIVGGKGEMKLGENSLVVFRRDQASESHAARAALVLLGGQLLGVMPAAGGDAAPVDIVAGGATTALRSKGSTAAAFAVSVDASKTSTFSVYSGEAELSSNGKTLVLKPNEAVTVSPAGVATAPVKIPDPPRPVSPADKWNQTFSTVVPQVELRWDAVADASKYHLVIATDPAFGEVEHDQKLTSTQLVHGNLRAGTHYWRVSSLTGAIESKPSATRSFTLEQDLDPPTLKVDIPAEVNGTDRLVIHGTTEPGSIVTVGHETVAISPTGEFEHAVVLKAGLNMIVIESTDAAGNEAYCSKYVNARF